MSASPRTLAIQSRQITSRNDLLLLAMANWGFLTKHGRALVCIAHDPEVRLRDIATALGITERSAYGIVTDLVEGGYVVKDKDGRRNRYQVQAHLPLREAIGGEPTIGQVLDLLVNTKTSRRSSGGRRCRPGGTR
jgi:IclR helix-turn-helix domain